MPDSPTYRPASAVASTQIDGTTTVLLHLSKQTYFELNRTGSRLWQLIGESGGVGVEKLTDVLYKEALQEASPEEKSSQKASPEEESSQEPSSQEHSQEEVVSRAEVRADVEAFIGRLLEADLLEAR